MAWLKARFHCLYSHARCKEAQVTEKVPFIGYSSNPKGYRLLNEGTGVWHDVTFETNLGERIVRISEDTVVKMLQVSPVNRRSTAGMSTQQQFSPPVRYGIDEYADTDAVCYNILKPSTIDEALASDHATEWKQAADLEYNSLMHNNNWELVELLASCKPTWPTRPKGNF